MANRAHVANILQAYGQATADEVKEGLAWYQLAREESTIRVHRVAETACGVVAALSPQCPWHRNIFIAGEFVAGRNVPTTRDRLKTADAILRGADPIRALGGNKVRSFYACLINPRHPFAVCVDRHTYSVWAGHVITDKRLLKLSDGVYGTIAGDYRAAARDVNILPSQLQAVTWLAWRRLHDSRGRKTQYR